MSNINTLADRYAQIKAEAEALNKKLEAIKSEIKEVKVTVDKLEENLSNSIHDLDRRVTVIETGCAYHKPSDT